MCEPAPDRHKSAYEALCKAHDDIVSFRTKILGLLPLASGGGIFLLLSDKLQPEHAFHLLPVGILGAAVTVGLFLYELRAISKCIALRERGMELEEKMLRENERQWGRFHAVGKGKYDDLIGARGAACVIYPAVLFGWIYVSLVGIWSITSKPTCIG